MRYIFKCEKCNKEYEYEMSFKEYDEFIKKGSKCNVCGEQMKRIYKSNPSIIYNSMGFYNTNKELEDKQVRKIMDI